MCMSLGEETPGSGHHGGRANVVLRTRRHSATLQQQGWSKKQVLFISQVALPLFKAEDYLHLISCNAVQSHTSSRVGIITTFNSSFNSSYRYIYMVH